MLPASANVVPQGLKPAVYAALEGTTSVVQSPDMVYKLSPHILYSSRCFAGRGSTMVEPRPAR
ncbi:MAG: hypothetical protein ABR976_07105, partial [Terracidiphilus sp.]